MKKIMVCLLLMPFLAFADGHMLLARCEKAESARTTADQVFVTNAEEGFDIGYCVGVLTTYRQRHEYMQKAKALGDYNNADFPVRQCVIPESVKVPQMISVLVKFLKDNPEDLDAWDAGLLEAAFLDAFPCN